MGETELLTAASLLLVEPLIDAQDPHQRSPVADSVRKLLAATLVELGSDASSPQVWPNLLDRLLEAFDEYADTSVDGEDLVSLAGDQLSACLEHLSEGSVDRDEVWENLRRIYETLDELRQRAGGPPSLGGWLDGVHRELRADPPSDLDGLRALVAARLTAARPAIEEANRVAFDRW